MKRSEIRVGEEYASTRSRDWTRWWDAKRVRVVDLGPFAEVSGYRDLDLGVIDGNPTKGHYRRDAKGTYVAVRHVSDNFEPESRVRFVSVSHLKTTWADYTAEKDAARKAQSEAAERDAKRQAAAKAERNELAGLATQASAALGEPVEAWFDANNQVVMTRDMFRILLNAALAVMPAEEATR